MLKSVITETDSVMLKGVITTALIIDFENTVILGDVNGGMRDLVNDGLPWMRITSVTRWPR
jgi:hypothetical protein